MADDERFWFWLLQGASKIPRGEIWAAFDTLNTLRIILVKLGDAIRKDYFQGYRRIGRSLVVPKS